MRAVTYKQIENYWLGLIGEDDIYARTLLHRYLVHLKNQRRLQTEINKMGVIDTVKNKHQQYTNPNKLLKEIRDIDKELRTIETSLEKLVISETPEETTERKPLI